VGQGVGVVPSSMQQPSNSIKLNSTKQRAEQAPQLKQIAELIGILFD
jgi:hypothetical protein